MAGHGEPKRKKSFMSFRLSKKKNVTNQSKSDVSENVNGGYENGVISETTESAESASESSSASVKPKKSVYLTRVSSFVSRVTKQVQAPTRPQLPTGQRNKLERSKTISETDLPSNKVEECVKFDDGRTPGVIGIRNHGNTCFINAVIQCLCHTDVLAEYFVMDQYKRDLSRANKINSKKYGTRGEVTENLAVLLKSLWTLRYVPDLSIQLKSTVDKFSSIYRGNQQHDAAEFLMFVLDKVHEDLNTASKRKYKKIKVRFGGILLAH